MGLLVVVLVVVFIETALFSLNCEMKHYFVKRFDDNFLKNDAKKRKLGLIGKQEELSIMTREEVINNLVPVLQQYPVKRAALFGSYARGDQSDVSDVDVIVDFMEGVSLVNNFYDLYDALEERLGLNVDLLRYGSVMRDMKPKLRQNILDNVRWFYEA